MAKRSKAKTLTNKLDVVCKNYVKDRDGWTCQWCGIEVEGKSAHWAHILPRSYGQRLRWDPRNAITLDPRCHWRWHEAAEGRQWYDKEFPENIEYLLKVRAEGKRLTMSDKEELLQAFEDGCPEEFLDGR